MEDIRLTALQKRWLALATVAALVLGVLFMRPYLSLIVVSSIAAYLFNPVYLRLTARFGKPGLSAMLTLIISLLTVIIPLCVVVLFTVGQAQKLLAGLDSTATITSINTEVSKALASFNGLLASWGINFQLTADQITAFARQLLENLGKSIVAFLTSSIGNLFNFFTLIILYAFVFANLLRHQSLITSTIAKLNILGEDLGRLYAQKIGAMTKATVRGQFTIALAQGFASTLGVYIAGIHGLFFFGLLIFTVISIIPLGAGIITIPLGIVLMLLGNVGGGLFLIAWHLIFVTNIDNVLRPRLVPKEAKLNSALMLLAVFAGLANFGFLGIVVGPVLMIVLVTTIQVFLATYHNVAIPSGEDNGNNKTNENKHRHFSGFRKLWRRGKSLFATS